VPHVIPRSRSWASRVYRRRRTIYAGLESSTGHGVAATTAVLTNRVRAWLRDAELRIRVPPEVVVQIVADGRYKSSFEVPGHEHLLVPKGATESALFGIPLNAPPIDHPKYGYLRGSSELMASEYGLVVLRLHDHVRKRATFTLGDSANETFSGKLPIFAPSAVRRPGLKALRTSFDDLGELRMFRCTPSGYCEIQIHGTLLLTDIAEIVFTAGLAPSVVLSQALDEAKVLVRSVLGGAP
jgi:hypothetical protein